MIFLEWLNSNQGVGVIVSFLVAFIIYGLGRLSAKRDWYREKFNLLCGLLKELEWNKDFAIKVFETNGDVIEFFDPTRANFKYPATVLSYALAGGQHFLRTKTELVRYLVALNGAINYYNQQVQEQHDCRFGSPEITSIATHLYQENPKILKKWMCEPESRPTEIMYFLSELRLRNDAINKGTINYLRPAYIIARQSIINEVDTLMGNVRWWKIWMPKFK